MKKHNDIELRCAPVILLNHLLIFIGVKHATKQSGEICNINNEC